MAYMAIETKFLGPTDYRGSRIKAWARDTFSDAKPVSVTVPYDYALDSDQNHSRAATELVPKVCSASGVVTLHKGATERGYVFVIVPLCTPWLLQ